MRSLRSNIGRIAWLALVALACQFVLSFGHVHLGKPSAGMARVVPGIVLGAADNTPAGNTPAPAGTTDEFCAICANISLASVLFVPVVLALLAPVLRDAALPWPQADITLITVSHLFSARGPPKA